MSKANPTMNLSATSGTIASGNTKTITISGSNYGTLSCSSSNTNVATCSISGTTLSISAITPGSATITVTGSGNSNYNSISKTYTASVLTKVDVPDRRNVCKCWCYACTCQDDYQGFASTTSGSMTLKFQYNGTSQQLTVFTSDTGYTLSGYNQVNAGDHSITATLRSGYAWSDNTTSAKTLTCGLPKAFTNTSVKSTINGSWIYGGNGWDLNAQVGKSYTLGYKILNTGATITFIADSSKITFSTSTITASKNQEVYVTINVIGGQVGEEIQIEASAESTDPNYSGIRILRKAKITN